MRKHKKDESTTYSDNDDRWNNQTYKVDVIGIVKNIGRPKSYPSNYNGEPPVMKYFMELEKVQKDGVNYEKDIGNIGVKVMVTCDDVERQNNRPAIGSKVHFKCTKFGEWLSIAARAPLEFWGDIYEEPEVVYITNQVLKISKVRTRSVLIEWYQKNGGVMKAFFPKGHVRLKGDTMDIEVDVCDEGKEVEVTEWIWKQKEEQDDWQEVSA